jgi:hypothetical protein
MTSCNITSFISVPLGGTDVFIGFTGLEVNYYETGDEIPKDVGSLFRHHFE